MARHYSYSAIAEEIREEEMEAEFYLSLRKDREEALARASSQKEAALVKRAVIEGGGHASKR